MIGQVATAFVPCDKVKEQYEVVKALCRFGNSSVYHARNVAQDISVVTIETTGLIERQLQQVEASIDHRSKFTHEHLLRVRFWSYELEPLPKKILYHFWLMYEDFVENLIDDIASRVRRSEAIGVGQLFQFMKHITSLFAELQAAKLCYKPIKTSNFYVTKDKYGKFDASYLSIVSDLSGGSLTVDRDYLAPELKGKMSAASISHSSDVFSLGLVLLEVTSLENIKGLNESDKHIKHRLSLLERSFPYDLLGLMKSMLSFDPAKRPTFRNLNEKLNAMDSAKIYAVGTHKVGAKIGELEESKYEPSYHMVVESESYKSCQLHALLPGTREFYEFSYTNKNQIEARRRTISGYSVPHECATIFTSDGQVFIIGGDTDRNSNCCQLNPSSLTITTKMPMIEKIRLSPSLCAIKKHVYACGGDTLTFPLVSFERYDTQNNTWKGLAPLRQPACNFTLTSLNDIWIYKIGGLSKSCKLLNLIEKYSVPEDRWERVPLILGASAPNFRILQLSHAVQINKNEIFVFGGCSEDKLINQSFVLSMSNEAEEYIIRVNSYLPSDRSFFGNSFVSNQVACRSGEIFFLNYISNSTVGCSSLIPELGWRRVKEVQI